MPTEKITVVRTKDYGSVYLLIRNIREDTIYADVYKSFKNDHKRPEMMLGKIISKASHGDIFDKKVGINILKQKALVLLLDKVEMNYDSRIEILSLIYKYDNPETSIAHYEKFERFFEKVEKNANKINSQKSTLEKHVEIKEMSDGIKQYLSKQIHLRDSHENTKKY